MKKSFLSVMVITISLCVIGNVYADDTAYYITTNGIELTEFQYNTLVKILSAERVRRLDETDYDVLHVAKMKPGEYTLKTEEFQIPDETTSEGIVPYSYHETPAKKLSLSRVCDNGVCGIAVTTYWKTQPKVTSYDVIGIRFDNTNFNKDVIGCYYSANGSGTASMDKKIKTSNGAACIKKISSGIDYMTIDADLNYKSNGIAFASYQHAVSSVTLSQASNFSFDGTGYGSVFLWPMSIRTKYDQMAGVSETLANL